MQKKALAIHDISCVGRCSMTIALPILSACGINTSVLPTAILSTHPGGFTGFTYRDLTEDIPKISNHFDSLNLKFDGIYSGFLGSAMQISMVNDIFDNFSDNNSLILLDPVMADHGKLYSIYSSEMIEGMKNLCAKADIITPNLTEAAFLLGEDYVGENYDIEYIKSTAKKLSSLGAKKIVITGVSFDNKEIGAFCYDSQTLESSFLHNKNVFDSFHGTGDIFASTLFSSMLSGFSFFESAQIAVDYTYHCIETSQNLCLEKRYGVAFECEIPRLLKYLKKF